VHPIANKALYWTRR